MDKLFIVKNELNCYVNEYPDNVEVVEITDEIFNKLAKGKAEWVNGEIILKENNE